MQLCLSPLSPSLRAELLGFVGFYCPDRLVLSPVWALTPTGTPGQRGERGKSSLNQERSGCDYFQPVGQQAPLPTPLSCLELQF